MKKTILALMLFVLTVTSVFAQQLTDGFEIWPSPNWNMIDTGSSTNPITQSSTYANTGTYSLRFSSFSSDSSYDQYLVSNEINWTDAENEFSFYHHKHSSGTEAISVGWSTTGNDVDTDFTWTETISPTTTWTQYLNTTLPAETKYVAIHYFSNFAYYCYIDDIVLGNPLAGTPDVPTLVSPSPGAINLAINTNLEWTSGENTDHAVLYLADNAEFTGATIVNPASSPYQTSLTNGTTYFWKVIAVSSTAIEISSVVSSFRTEYGVISDLPWNEDFEDDDFDWTIIDNNNDDDAWLTNASGYAYDGTQSASIHTDFNHGDNDDYLITPQLALTGGERLKFWSRVRSATEAENFEVLLSTTGKNPEDFTEIILPNASYINTSYEEINIDLSAYSGNCYLAFHVPADETDGYYLYLDNVTVEEIPANPIVEISTEAIEFGSVALNESSDSEIISLSNIGGGTLNITNVVISGSDADQFSFEDSEDYALTASEDLLIEVTFNPTSAGEKTATLQITDDLTRLVYEIALTATGIDTNINEINIPYTQDFETETAFLGWTSNINSSATSATADRYSYSYNAHNGSYSYRVYNSTDAATSAELISPLVVPDMDAYRIKFWAKTSTIANTEAIVLGKYNQAMDSFTAIDTLEITTSYAEYTVNMAAPQRANERIAFQFSFTATSQYIYIDDILFEEAPEGSLVQITPDVKDFGEVLVGYEESQLFTVYNNGSQAAQITEIVAPNGYSFESSETTPFSLEVEESFTITVNFNPLAEMMYSGSLKVKEYNPANPFQGISHDVALTGTGIPVPQGANCSDPLALSFPAVDLAGNTEGLIDDYSSAWISPSSSYLNGDDAVYQFTLDNKMVLNGSITTSGTYIGAFILEDEPNLETPAEVVLLKTSYSNTLTYTNNEIEAGTYYLIISSYPSPQSIDYTINLTADSLPIPVAASYPSPATEAIDQATSLTLGWTNAPYTESIDLYFGQAGARDMVKVLDNVPAVDEYEVTDLTPNTSYNWKVINRNYSGQTVDSLVTTWSFTTIGQAPEAVAYTSPADEATDITINGNLTWQTADRATGYNVYFSTDETFASVTPVDQTETSYAFSGLDYSTTYYWKVIPYNVVGSPSEGILTWSFTTMEDPSLILPVMVNFDESTSMPVEITSHNMSVGETHGNASNGLYRNIWGSSPDAYAQFQVLRNVEADTELNFEYRIVTYTSYPENPQALVENDYIKVKVSTDGGANYDDVYEINSTNHVVTTDFAQVSVALGDYAGQYIVVRLEAHRAAGDYFVDFDNFYFRVPPTTPIAQLSTEEIDFGQVILGESSDTISLAITNIGGGTMNISDIAINGSNATDFAYSISDDASMALAFGESLTINVLATPTIAGDVLASLDITDDLNRMVNSVSLTASGYDATITGSFYNGFENDTDLMGWKINLESSSITATAARYSASYSAYAGTYSYRVYNPSYATTNAELITPIITPELSDYRVKFWAKGTGTLVIGKYNQSMESFTAIDTISNLSSYSYAEYIIDLISARDNERLAFQFETSSTSYSATYLYLDDLTFEEIPAGPIAELDISEIDFESVDLNEVSSVETITISNVGVGTLNITDLQITGPAADQFAFETEEDAPIAIEANESIEIEVTFAPTSEGTKEATLVITNDLGLARNIRIGKASKSSNTNRNTNSVSLTGVGFDPTISLPITIDFNSSTSTPNTIANDNFLIGVAHGNVDNVMYKNVYNSSTNGFIEFQLMNNIQETSVMEFDYRVISYYSPYSGIDFETGHDYLIAQVSTDNGETFTTIDQINSENHVTSDEMTQYTVDISAYAGQTVIFRLEMNDDTVNDYWFDIDNIHFGEHVITSLDVPINVVMNMDSASMTITWDAVDDAASYKVYACDTPDGADDEWIMVENVSGTSYTSNADSRMKFYKVMAFLADETTPAAKRSKRRN